MSSTTEAESVSPTETASSRTNELFLLTVANQVALLLVLLGIVANLAGVLSPQATLFLIVLLFAGYSLLLTVSLLRVRGSESGDTEWGEADV